LGLSVIPRTVITLNCLALLLVCACSDPENKFPAKKENTPAQCQDGADNDGDGYTDCKDQDCKSLPICRGKDSGPDSTDASPDIKIEAIPSIKLAPAALSFACIEGGANPPAQKASLTNNGQAGSVLKWTASANQLWLEVTPTMGTTVKETDSIAVSVNAVYQLEAWKGATQTSGAPVGRFGFVTVWTGKEMIVWGGSAETSAAGMLNSGARYNPLTNTWAKMSTTGAPSARREASAVWTGSQMIVWGGFDKPGSKYLGDGGRYDPATDKWQPIASNVARYGHRAVWTGKEMIVWGGRVTGGAGETNTGMRYNPAINKWSGITSTKGAPSPRRLYAAAWTGKEMVVWGGVAGGATTNTGGIYNPQADTWRTVTLTDAPAARYQHTAVWNGKEMIIWGGMDQSFSPVANGGRFDPTGNKWLGATVTASSPKARFAHGAVWTGKTMIVWGGQNGSSSLADGALYSPAIPAIGTHDATISLAAPGASNSPQNITVKLTVNKQ